MNYMSLKDKIRSLTLTENMAPQSVIIKSLFLYK